MPDHAQPDHAELILHRRDPARNLARFYALALAPSLFGDVALIRRWGRIGRHGRYRIELHADEGAARASLEHWYARKTRRGYRASSPQ